MECCSNPRYSKTMFGHEPGKPDYSGYSCSQCDHRDPELEYEPELGQALFGNPHGSLDLDSMDECGNIVGLLRALSQKAVKDSGYSDTFDNEVFGLRAYYWGDDEEIASKPNFIYKPSGLEFRWYKYIGRGMTSNQEICFDCFLRIFVHCIGTLNEK